MNDVRLFLDYYPFCIQLDLLVTAINYTLFLVHHVQLYIPSLKHAVEQIIVCENKLRYIIIFIYFIIMIYNYINDNLYEIYQKPGIAENMNF